ncbi:fused response regulator of ato opeon, in two-component system with AtoS: response regulator; sigma54 interaction protein [Candidatus Propionivibrio aalborgensis]|jgi:two-component system response regulator FlrC|uniref:Fused response regulator of ato opeon, in two-component system with AtoS: response regulator sigma54 interaction protein n=1 Tax=Candidatus Propionivibrio aalborgensis TaxID=1860101 RepID=A0A1A8XSP4_9RHOO|nr:sigma-54 dependent transcriptional regulator [Candidatus Propionivibrio aalborgensis]MBK7327386.1 sigma-54-dependent Fis family transcriptional regulator [Propionivibrio sp.]MBK7566074.1 sigma-54-dependent Fis family transcriptional regulator [Propionivibrio sp.]MBK9029491.1 sigma-54-dependent Fis family transcriptional regulator [Propionivibrio sp.]MBP6421439.1 sigma-54-dependent Fis family transcriptional regulator [Propionivibrio sp.]SBT07527.1 fused response regulator of ato opeon, in t
MSSGLPILIVEDDPNLREAVCDTLELAGQAVVSAQGGEEALKLLDAQAVALVVSDVRMMPMDGISLLKEIRSRFPHLPVVLMTAFADVDRAVEAMRSGACDFLLKPFEPRSLLEHVARYRLPETMDDDRVIATDQVTRNLFALAMRVAQTDTTVLLTGESGVGKEVVAKYIHNHSARCSGPFVAINCAAIPDNLLEATLFGYEKGAFTGAQQSQAGKFEQAQGGTLLLDEVTEMPLGLQAKLLRVLQEREVERVGGKKPVALDIRIIATSNRDIADAVAKGVFREDVYYRLNVFPLLIPALCQRREDIVPLARRFLAEHGGRSGRTGLRLAPSAEEALYSHSWPGNVRELENVMQRAVILAAGEVVGVDELHLLASASLTRAARQGAMVEAAIPASPAALSDGQRTDNMRDLEREHILETLAAVGGSRKLTGERLGMSERTLRYKLKQYREAGLFDE